MFLEDTSDTEREPVSSENDEEVKIYEWKQSDNLPKKKISSQAQNSVVLDIRRDVLEPERPKTRRQGRYDDEYISEKFRTEPKALLELDDQDYDLLKTKLNTISETTESDDSRVSVPFQQKISKIGKFLCCLLTSFVTHKWGRITIILQRMFASFSFI